MRAVLQYTLIIVCIYLSSGVLAVQVDDFSYATNSQGTITITGYTGAGGLIEIPSFIDGLPVEIIEEHVFNNIDSISNVAFPNTLKTIERYNFYNCDGITNVSIPDSVTYLGYRVFNNCDSLTFASVGSGVSEMDRYVFGGCGSLTSVVVSVSNLSFKSVDGVLFDKSAEMLIMHPMGKSGSYTVPESVESIYLYAFSQTVLTNLSFGSNLREIRHGAFANSKTLKRISLPDSVEDIEGRAFISCSGLEDIDLGSGLRELGNEVFYACSSLKRITIPNDIKSIGWGSFRSCSNLENVELPDGLTYIGSEAFQYCYSLTNCVLPAGVSSIGKRAFLGCGKLSKINIPDGITEIEEWTFSSCPIEEIILPEGVTRIGDWAFNYCYNLTNVVMSTNVTYLGAGAFQDCYRLLEIEIPSGVTNLNDFVFSGCKSLASIYVPPNIISIGAAAFQGCNNLKTMTIGQGVTTIGDGALNIFLSKLESVYFLGDAPSDVADIVLSHNDYTQVYYLPETSGWSNTLFGSPTMEWSPELNYILEATNNSIQFSIAGPDSLDIIWETRSALNAGNWQSVATNTFISNSVHFVDGVNGSNIFYRAVLKAP